MSKPSVQTESDHLQGGLEQLGRQLLQALGGVLDAIPSRPSRPQELARELSINKDLSSRLVAALSKGDPLAAVHLLPGPVPLRQFVRAARRAGVPAAATRTAKAAIDLFDDYVREEFGARANLQGLLSTYVPDAREQLEATSKQAVFRGRAGVRGLEIEAVLVSFLVHPSADDPDWCDTAVINSTFGLRRSRPNAQFSFTMRSTSRDPEKALKKVLLPQFCRPNDLNLVARSEGDRVRHTLASEHFGRRCVTDIVTTEHYPGNHPLDPLTDDGDATRWFYASVDQPTRNLVFDVLIHQDVWAGVEPELMIYDMAMHGEVVPGDPVREASRLDLLQKTTRFSAADGIPRCAEVPRYKELLEHVAGLHDWSLESFVGHRVQVSYPLYGSQYCLTFNPKKHPKLSRRGRPEAKSSVDPSK